MMVMLACSGKKEETAEHGHHEVTGEAWKEMDDFHMIMAEAFHPYKDSMNLEPAKLKAPELAASVMARIARIPQPMAAPARATERETSSIAKPRGSQAWAPALGALSGALAIVLLGESGGIVRADLWSFREPSFTSLLAMPELGGGTLALVACLLVYAAALFAPIRHGRRDPF